MDDSNNSSIEQRPSRWQRLRTALRKAYPFAAGVGAALLSLWIYSLAFPAPHTLTAQELSDTIANTMASATPPPAYSVGVYQVIQPSLVLILTKGQAADGSDNGGLGSGVVIDDAGDILTSLHVVDGASDIQLTFADGSKSSAQVVSTQPDHDIAVLRANQPPAQLVPATLGNPSSMRVGDEAYVVGNPFGLYSSMSAGVVSGLHRSFQPPNRTQKLEDLIQIDTAVNPGNSGGPLLNRYGQVVGIVAGIVNPTGQDVFIGIGFAVPIDVAGGGLGSPPD